VDEPGDDLHVRVGEVLARGSRAGSTVRVSPLMVRVLPRLRALLVDAAMRGATLTYGEVALALDHAYLQQGLGPVLDVLAEDCARRGEPRLDALVVTAARGEVGPGFGGDAARDREACWSYWSERGTTRQP
jgi:hypothetical protein